MQPKEKEIGFEIKVLSNLIKRAIGESIVDSGVEDMTGLHGMVIGFIYHRSKLADVYQRDIEVEFNIRRSTVTGILQLMVKNGLITREHVKHDARLKKLKLTPKAIKLHEMISQKIAEIENQLRSGITQEEIHSFFTIIDKIKKNIE